MSPSGHEAPGSAGKPIPGRWRLEFLFVLLLLALAALTFRLVQLLRHDSGRAAALAKREQEMIVPLPGRTGSIYLSAARRFSRVAVSYQAACCFVDPALLNYEQWGEASYRIAEALSPGRAERHVDRLRWDLFDRILARRRASDRFVVLMRDLGPEQVEAVRALKLRAVGITYESRREYPGGSLASAVLGFRRKDGLPGAGVELTFHDHLRAVDGRRVTLADARRRPIWPLTERSRPPRDGGSVYLCLNVTIQKHLEQAVGEAVTTYQAEWGTGVVVDPHSGEVLAMCSMPTFDPNAYATAGAASMTNRAISVPAEPGSVLKPVFAAAAVEAGVVSYGSIIDCGNGVYTVRGGGRISDHGQSMGRISLGEVVARSSSIGMAKIGEMLGNERLHEISRRFGFGAPTGIDLPGESRGQLRPLRDRNGRMLWNGYSLRRVPFGQEISVTSLQLVMAFSALVNGGILFPPRLIDHVTNAAGETLPRPAARGVRVLSEAVSRQTIAVLRSVVEHERGTGRKSKLSRWTSFGKTGTAQIPGRGGYNNRDYMGSYIAGPEIGYYGGKVAAPYVKRVLERTMEYLRVPPDRSDALAAWTR